MSRRIHDCGLELVRRASLVVGGVCRYLRPLVGAGVVEVEWTVGPVDVSDFQSHEVITRYEVPGRLFGKCEGPTRTLILALPSCRSGNWWCLGHGCQLQGVRGQCPISH